MAQLAGANYAIVDNWVAGYGIVWQPSCRLCIVGGLITNYGVVFTKYT
jgi:hypothetical protein